MTQSDFGGPNVKPGQPQIYVGTDSAPGGGKKLHFIQTHGRTPLSITVSKQDYETLLRDGGWQDDNHPEEWCGNPCACEEAGRQHQAEPPDRV